MSDIEKVEELIKKTKPHSASFLDSPTFWLGLFVLIMGIALELMKTFILFGLLLIAGGVLLILLSYLRRVLAYTFCFTDRKVVSDYSFLRKQHREIYYDKMIDVMAEQGIFGKAFGYADVWLYGYQNGWIVGRMRGVRLGDCRIILKRAWKYNDEKNVVTK